MLSDCLVSYPGHSWEGSYTSAERQCILLPQLNGLYLLLDLKVWYFLITQQTSDITKIILKELNEMSCKHGEQNKNNLSMSIELRFCFEFLGEGQRVQWPKHCNKYDKQDKDTSQCININGVLFYSVWIFFIQVLTGCLSLESVSILSSSWLFSVF